MAYGFGEEVAGALIMATFGTRERGGGVMEVSGTMDEQADQRFSSWRIASDNAPAHVTTCGRPNRMPPAVAGAEYRYRCHDAQVFQDCRINTRMARAKDG